MAVIKRPNGVAPIPRGTYHFGAKGGRMAQAWQYVWDRLDHTTFRNGQDLADQAAAEFGVKRASVAEMLSRMRSTGVLEQELIPVPTTYARGAGYTANRPRVHYRIAAAPTLGCDGSCSGTFCHVGVDLTGGAETKPGPIVHCERWKIQP